jgi:hypothetical protein
MKGVARAKYILNRNIMQQHIRNSHVPYHDHDYDDDEIEYDLEPHYKIDMELNKNFSRLVHLL